jgi:uncharacterized membrane protein YbhN (UPF0104 family)
LSSPQRAATVGLDMAPPQPPAAAPARRPSRLRRIGPWIVAAATLGFLFAAIEPEALAAALRGAPLGPFVAFSVAYVVLVLLADTFATWATFRRSLPESGLTFKETLLIRGASYALAIIHYGAGQGGIAYFVSRRHGVPLARAAGAVMLIMGVNVVAVALLALIGVLLGGAPGSPALRTIVLGLACGFPAYLAVIAARPRFLARTRLLAPLFDAGLPGHAVAVLARLPHLAWLVVGQYVAMRFFGIDVPVASALTLLPLVFVVAVLPISPSGIGTAQATAVALFSTYAPAATVLACFLAFQICSLLTQAVIGLAFLRGISRADIVEPEG